MESICHRSLGFIEEKNSTMRRDVFIALAQAPTEVEE